MDSTPPSINKTNGSSDDRTDLPVLPPGASSRPPLVPERNDFLEGEAPAADKVQAFLPAPWRPRATTRTRRPRPWPPGSATPSCPTTRSRPTAATSWTSSAACRPKALPTGGHRRPHQAEQARPDRSRHDRRDGRPAALGAARRLPTTGGQGIDRLGDRPGPCRDRCAGLTEMNGVDSARLAERCVSRSDERHYLKESALT